MGVTDKLFEEQPSLLIKELECLKDKIVSGEKNLFDNFDENLKLFVRNYEQFFHALNESTIIGVTDAAGKILYVNRRFCDISQFSREEIIGKTHRIIKSDHHGPEFFKQMWDKISVGEVWRGQIKNRAKDGTNYWVQTTIVPIKNSKGKVVMQIALRTDITEGKLLEEELRKRMTLDYQNKIKMINNIIFKLQKTSSGKYVYTSVEGQLFDRVNVEINEMEGFTPFEVFSESKARFLTHQYDRCFLGEQVSYKYELSGRWFYTTMTPIMENGNVKEAIATISDITEMEAAQKQIEYLAYFDELTGLPNRRRLIEDLQVDNTDHSKHFAFFYTNINNFKQVNDTLGFTVGDELIKDISTRFANFVKGMGKVYRIGGDEFVVLADAEYSIDQIEELATGISNLMTTPFRIKDHILSVTCRQGITHYPELSNDVEKMLQHSHIALERCKNLEKECFVLYNEQLSEEYKEKVQLEQELRKAIEKKEFVLYYQPKVDIKKNALIGMEALIRWNSPKYGFVSPAVFIPLAEETGLIGALGDWVLRSACKQNQSWIEQGNKPLTIAVNVSALELQRPDYVEGVKHVLEETGLKPEYLELEITENSVLSQANSEVMGQLKELGIYLSIDDFGTGYSSLSYLKSFPIHTLKIDKSFVFDLLQNESDAEIVKAIIQIANTFKLKVIAEGVEDLHTMQFLLKNKCDQAQGYLISPPIPAEQMEEFFKEPLQVLSR